MENLSLLFLIFITVYDDHIFLSFDKDLPGQSSCHLYMPFQLLQNQASGHIKVKKGSGHVFYMATPSHTNESVVIYIYHVFYDLSDMEHCPKGVIQIFDMLSINKINFIEILLHIYQVSLNYIGFR